MSVFAPAYELFGPGYLGQFSDDLFENSIYAQIGTPTLIVTVVSMMGYYYLLANYGSLYKTKFWFLWLLCIAIINFSICFYIVTHALYDIYGGNYPVEYEGNIYMISFINLMWTIVIGFILSTVLKLKSVQASRTPF